MDSGHRVLDWNPAAERLFGYTKAEALGRVCFELLQSSPRDLIDTIISRVEAGDMAAHCVNECRTKDHRVVTCDWFNPAARSRWRLRRGHLAGPGHHGADARGPRARATARRGLDQPRSAAGHVATAPRDTGK